MPELWASTVNTIEAAVLGTLGVGVKLDRTLLAGGGAPGQEGEIKVRWHLRGGDVIQGVDTQLAGLRTSFWDGSMEKEQPLHRMLDCFRGVRNFQRILDLQHDKSIALRRVPGCARWQYQLAEVALPGRFSTGANATTGNLAMAAALGVVGIPLLELEGPSEGRHKYFLPVYGEDPVPGQRGADTVALMKGWNDRSLEAGDPEHPFLYAMRAILNWRSFTRQAREMTANLAMLKPQSTRGAIIPETASGKTFDKVTRFFNS